jgi:hypothetical protein
MDPSMETIHEKCVLQAAFRQRGGLLVTIFPSRKNLAIEPPDPGSIALPLSTLYVLQEGARDNMWPLYGWVLRFGSIEPARLLHLLGLQRHDRD